jgi:hypothetical protein
MYQVWSHGLFVCRWAVPLRPLIRVRFRMQLSWQIEMLDYSRAWNDQHSGTSNSSGLEFAGCPAIRAF